MEFTVSVVGVFVFFCMLFAGLALALAEITRVVYFYVRKIPEVERADFYTKYRLVMNTIFVICGLPQGAYAGYNALHDITSGDDYWGDSGFADYYRLPLEYPYELVAADRIDDKMQLRDSRDDRTVLSEVTKYYKSDMIIVGEFNSVSGSGFFVLDCRGGKLKECDSKDLLMLAIKKYGFKSVPEMNSMRENWDAYWSNPRNGPVTVGGRH